MHSGLIHTLSTLNSLICTVQVWHTVVMCATMQQHSWVEQLAGIKVTTEVNVPASHAGTHRQHQKQVDQRASRFSKSGSNNTAVTLAGATIATRSSQIHSA